jgi:hypothetical protein
MHKSPSRPYAALSYTWGAASTNGSHLTDVIYCDGKVLWVTVNLNNTLKRIRQNWNSIRTKAQIDTDGPQHVSSPSVHFSNDLSLPRLWVDAICVNQADLDERAREVARMDWIYSHCLALLIYLGEVSRELARQLSLRVRWGRVGG